MGTDTIRRFALVAALVLLAPVWSQTSVVARAVEPGGAMFVATPPGTAPSAALRRQAPAGWWVRGARPDNGRSVAVLAVVALFSLLRLVPWGRLEAKRSAPPALSRRRHVISLRAPPLLLAA